MVKLGEIPCTIEDLMHPRAIIDRTKFMLHFAKYSTNFHREGNLIVNSLCNILLPPITVTFLFIPYTSNISKIW